MTTSTSQQVIDVGAVANDGTGESLRDAFNAVNNNFANVWAAGPVGSNVLIRNNEVTTDVTNLDLKIAGNGVGNVVVASTLQPTIDGVYDLGRAGQRWGEVHAEYYYGNGAFLTGIDAGNSFTTIDANGTPIVADGGSSVLTLTAGNNLVMLGNSTTDTINFAVTDSPNFVDITANQLSANIAVVTTVTADDVVANTVAANIATANIAEIESVSANTVTANVANVTTVIASAAEIESVVANQIAANVTNTTSLVSDTAEINTVTANGVVITTVANIGNISISDTTITTTQANANIVISPEGTGVISATANIVAPNFIGNVVGNISGNLTAPGANTEVIFNDRGQANAVPNFTYDKVANTLSVTGNVSATNLSGTGYAISAVVADRGGDTTNWNTLLQMGTYTVNRVNWGGVTGAPLDSQVYVGLLEVKTANTQGSVLSVEQSYYPGTIDNVDNVKIQFNRSLWNGSWTPWVKMTNDGQQIDGGSF